MLWVSWVLLVSVLTGDVAAIKFFNYNLISVLFLGNEGTFVPFHFIRFRVMKIWSFEFVSFWF